MAKKVKHFTRAINIALTQQQLDELHEFRAKHKIPFTRIFRDSLAFYVIHYREPEKPLTKSEK